MALKWNWRINAPPLEQEAMASPHPNQRRIIQWGTTPMIKQEGPVQFGPPWLILFFAVDAVITRQPSSSRFASQTIVGMVFTPIK